MGRSWRSPTPVSSPPTAIAVENGHTAHNYSPLPVVAATRGGRLDHRRRGPALPRLPGRVLGGEFRPPPPTDHRHRARATRRRHAGEPRIPFRSARTVLRRARRTVRQGHGAADEQRRRGGRERHQSGPQVGHRRQGSACRPGEYRGGGRTTSTAAPSDRQLLLRRDARGGFGPFTPGFRVGAVRRRRRAGRARSTTTRSRCCSSRSRARPGIIVPPDDYLPRVRALCTDATC